MDKLSKYPTGMDSPEFERKVDVEPEILEQSASIVRYASEQAAAIAESRAARLELEANIGRSGVSVPAIRMADAFMVLKAVDAIRAEESGEMSKLGNILDSCEEAMEQLIKDATDLLATKTITPN